VKHVRVKLEFIKCLSSLCVVNLFENKETGHLVCFYYLCVKNNADCCYLISGIKRIINLTTNQFYRFISDQHPIEMCTLIIESNSILKIIWWCFQMDMQHVFSSNGLLFFVRQDNWSTWLLVFSTTFSNS